MVYVIVNTGFMSDDCIIESFISDLVFDREVNLLLAYKNYYTQGKDYMYFVPANPAETTNVRNIIENRDDINGCVVFASDSLCVDIISKFDGIPQSRESETSMVGDDTVIILHF